MFILNAPNCCSDFRKGLKCMTGKRLQTERKPLPLFLRALFQWPIASWGGTNFNQLRTTTSLWEKSSATGSMMRRPLCSRPRYVFPPQREISPKKTHDFFIFGPFCDELFCVFNSMDWVHCFNRIKRKLRTITNCTVSKTAFCKNQAPIRARLHVRLKMKQSSLHSKSWQMRSFTAKRF